MDKGRSRSIDSPQCRHPGTNRRTEHPGLVSDDAQRLTGFAVLRAEHNQLAICERRILEQLLGRDGRQP